MPTNQPATTVRTTIWLLILSVVIVLLLWRHSNQMEECDKNGGVLVKSGLSNVCVDEKKVY